VDEKDIDWLISMIVDVGTIVALKELDGKTVKVPFPE
jgi:hypothetical protein